MQTQRMSAMKKILIVALCAVLLLGMIAAALYMNQEEEPIPDAGVAKTAPADTRTLTYQGTEYPLKRHLQTVLVIGTDSVDEYTEIPGEERRLFSNHQADFLMLLVLDQDTGKAEVIQVNRDTITDVPRIDAFGEPDGTERERICLAFDYGDGGDESCMNTVNAVSTLLFNLPVDAYIQLPMTAACQLNDLLGGVMVTIPEDMTAVDPAFKQGKPLLLTGAQAERFVRVRDPQREDDNLARMRRHRVYMNGFLGSLDASLWEDKDFTRKAMDTVGNLLRSNMAVTKLFDFTNQLETAVISPVRFAEGELRLEQCYVEFYVDEASLWEIVHEACCE